MSILNEKHFKFFEIFGLLLMKFSFHYFQMFVMKCSKCLWWNVPKFMFMMKFSKCLWWNIPNIHDEMFKIFVLKCHSWCNISNAHNFSRVQTPSLSQPMMLTFLFDSLLHHCVRFRLVVMLPVHRHTHQVFLWTRSYRIQCQPSLYRRCLHQISLILFVDMACKC
jgi:hypothetical protein